MAMLSSFGRDAGKLRRQSERLTAL